MKSWIVGLVFRVAVAMRGAWHELWVGAANLLAMETRKERHILKPQVIRDRLGERGELYGLCSEIVHRHYDNRLANGMYKDGGRIFGRIEGAEKSGRADIDALLKHSRG